MEERRTLCYTCTNICPIMGNKKRLEAWYEAYIRNVQFGSTIFREVAESLAGYSHHCRCSRKI